MFLICIIRRGTSGHVKGTFSLLMNHRHTELSMAPTVSLFPSFSRPMLQLSIVISSLGFASVSVRSRSSSRVHPCENEPVKQPVHGQLPPPEERKQASPTPSGWINTLPAVADQSWKHSTEIHTFSMQPLTCHFQLHPWSWTQHGCLGRGCGPSADRRHSREAVSPSHHRNVVLVCPWQASPGGRRVLASLLTAQTS